MFWTMLLENVCRISSELMEAFLTFRHMMFHISRFNGFAKNLEVESYSSPNIID